MKKLRVLTSMAYLGSVLALAGCSNKEQEKPKDIQNTQLEQSEDAVDKYIKDGTHMKIAMVTDIGGVQDRSFNQSAWEGLERAERSFGVKISYLESMQESDYITNLETLTGRGNDMIFGVGYKMADAVKEIASDYTKQEYALIDFVFDPAVPNIESVSFRDNESSYLVGYIAGKTTQTNKIGFVGGMKGIVVDRFEFGFRAGVEAANPDAEVIVQYANHFADQAAGKAIGTNMYQSGADIVFQAAGDTGIGVIEAAKEQDKFVIGVDMDQIDLAPDNMLTSTTKEVGNAMYDIVGKMIDGTYEGGKTIEYGLFNSGVGIAPSSVIHVDEELLNEVLGVIASAIIEGKTFVPQNEEEYNESR
jgi:basic membrane protein A and related proteins